MSDHDNHDAISIIGGSGFPRRAFLKGAAGVGMTLGMMGLSGGFFYEDANAAPDPGNTTIPLPTTTAPEQLHLQWGGKPTKEVTVSWLAPGTVAQPAPRLVYSRSPITPHNPGTVIELPNPEPFDPTRPRPKAAATSFTDGLTGFTTYHYHVQLTDLEPDTTYYYEVTDGAASPTTTGSSFKTAPEGRVKYRFSSYGDMGVPSSQSPINVSGYDWSQGNDVCVYEVDAIENPGDGLGAPLFHLLNGDLCYANADPANGPTVWRDFGVNVARSAANRPWMPTLGNHECEFGICDQAGHPFPGPIGEASAAGSYWNGAYGNGHYHSRFVLPDNGVVNHDGNRLQGAFYKFQVGTVLFIALDADDVIYQQDLAENAADRTFQSGAALPAHLGTNNREYTGTLVPGRDHEQVPGGSTPNLQLRWLEQTLAEARRDQSVDMIVVFMHQVPLCTIGPTPDDLTRGSDFGIRRTWLPLFDKYEVDLVLSGHAHLYERSYPVRGFDPPSGTTIAAFDNYQVGDTVDTLRPSVAATQPTMVNGTPGWNTSNGTVYLVLGGAGAAAAPYGIDPANGMPRANIWMTINTRNAVEDAPWSAGRNNDDPYGYAIFDVDPGHGRGETTITYQYFAVPPVAKGGTIDLPTTPFEKFVFGRKIGGEERGAEGSYHGRQSGSERVGTGV